METLVNSLHDSASRFRSHPGLPRPFPNVHAGIAKCESMNACAFRVGDTYYIAVCRGVFDLLSEAFIRLLSRADVFPWLGNAPAAKLLSTLPPLKRDLAMPTPNLANFTYDPVRLGAASWMGSRAIEFIVAHEVRHLTGGHVDYFANVLNADVIVEAASVGALSEKNQIKQAIELEADFAAVIGVLEPMFGPQARQSLDVPFVVSTENKPYSVLCLALTAITAVFKLFGNPLPDYAQWENSDHPPDEVRRYAILDCAAANLKLWGHAELADLSGTVGEMLNAIDVALHQILDDPPTTYYRRTLFGRDVYGDGYFSKLVKVRERIQPDVAPFAFVDTGF